MTRPRQPAAARLTIAAAACLAVCAGCNRSGSERRLVIAYPTGLHSTDIYDPAHEEFATSILGNVYQALVEIDPDLTLRPGLAESWHSPDDWTWVFTLRKGVRFHDGRVLAASDVAASFERARRRGPYMRGELGAVTEVKARGEREVVFTTSSPFNSLPSRLTFLFVTGGPGAAGAPAPGTGPYRVRSWEPGGTTVLEAFPQYRDGPPPIPVVEIQTVPDARERARRLREGQVQLISDVLPEEIGKAAAAKIQILSQPGLRVLFLGMDCGREQTPYVKPAGNPFRDRRVREAVALAIDRDALVKGPLHGYAERIDELPGPDELGFDPSLPRRDSDLARATSVLARVVPGGFDVELDYMQGKYLAMDAVIEALAAQLGRAGVRAHPHPYTPSEYLRRVESHDTSLYVLGWMNDSGSAHETYASLLHSPLNGLGAINGGAYANPELDALLDALPSARTHDRRVELLRQATRLVDGDLPIVPLYRQKSVYAFSSKLDFQPRPRLQLARMRWKN